jgi:hypothetical protein
MHAVENTTQSATLKISNSLENRKRNPFHGKLNRVEPEPGPYLDNACFEGKVYFPSGSGLTFAKEI